MRYYIMRGLPASGKTTFANDLSAQNIGRDGVRRELFDMEGKKLDFSREDEVTGAQNALIAQAAEFGRSVVADEMNLRARYMARHMNNAKHYGFEVVVIDLRAVSVQKCLNRDVERDASRQVGKDTIISLYNTYIKGVKL